MSRFLLDSSFVIDLLNEIAANQRGPARAWAARNPGAELWISPVTSAEVSEGASDTAAVREVFRAFRWQTIGHQQAERAALRDPKSGFTRSPAVRFSHRIQNRQSSKIVPNVPGCGGGSIPPYTALQRCFH